MKITFLTSSYPRFTGDGTAPFVQSIAQEMVALGHRVDVVVPYDPSVQQMDSGGVVLHRFRYFPIKRMHVIGHARSLQSDVRIRPLSYILLPFFFIAATLNLVRVVRQTKADAIYAHWVVPNGPVAALASIVTRTPFILSLHGSDIYVAEKSRLLRRVAGWVFKRAAGITACSPHLRDGAIRMGAPESVLLMPWGANPAIFQPNQRGGVQENDAQPIKIAALGRMVHKKGFGVLLEAIPEVLRAYPQVKFVFGGDGPLREPLMAAAKELSLESVVEFPGSIPWNKVPDFLASADIFVLPSVRDYKGNQDGLPTVLLEAMSSGNAVVASDISGVSLVVRHNQNGLLVSPGDGSALACAITDILQDPIKRSELSQQARADVVQTYNWRNISRQLVELMKPAAPKNEGRLGTLYRMEVLRLLGKLSFEGRVFDIGCFDGAILSKIQAPEKYAADLQPVAAYSNVSYMAADGCFLPVQAGTADQVFALDVIEHIADDQAFASELVRLLAPGGRLFLTTPSINIRMFPPFLTGWISKKWGHHLRLGYSPEQLQKLFGSRAKIYSWNAPTWRLIYLPLRLIFPRFPRIASRLVRVVAQLDYRYSKGKRGYYFLDLQNETFH